MYAYLADAFCPVFCRVFAQLEWLNHLLTFQFQELKGTHWVIPYTLRNPWKSLLALDDRGWVLRRKRQRQ